MKARVRPLLFALIGAALLPCGCATPPPAAQPPVGETKPAVPALTNAQDQASYAIGMDLGKRIKRAELEVNMDALRSGIEDALADRPLQLTDQQARMAIVAYQQQRQEKLAAKNLKEGEAYLAENKMKEGVKVLPVTLPDGKVAELQYKIIQEGTGATPGSNDVVTVNYRGTLIDGKEFDSSAKHGKPATFPVNHFVRGWSVALQMMKVGSKWELYLPASLAYGDRSMPGIGPGSTLIIDVELLGIEQSRSVARSTPPLTSDIIRVPSADEMKAGAKIEVIKPEDVEKQRAAGQTNNVKGDVE